MAILTRNANGGNIPPGNIMGKRIQVVMRSGTNSSRILNVCVMIYVLHAITPSFALP